MKSTPRFDYDENGDEYCAVGGEMASGRVMDGLNDWKPDPTCHDMSERVTGSEYDYLGHFRQTRWLDQGHNDVAMPGIDQSLLQAGMSAGQAQSQSNRSQPNKAGSQTRGVLGNALDNVKESLGLSGSTNGGDYGGGDDGSEYGSNY